MSKVALVLEGGAMRGMYTAGVLDSFIDYDIKVDTIISVSAGALFGVNYASKQRGRALNYNTKYLKYPMYMSLKSLVKTGNVVNKEFAYYILPKRLDVFDQEKFEKSNIDYYATVTNVETGEAEYIKISNVFEQMEYLRASSAMPFLSEVIEIDNKKYLDGGIADSIPIEKAKSMNFDKIILILTRDIEYRKKENHNKIIEKLTYKKYGRVLGDVILSRGQRYNNTVSKIIDYENKKEIFVIRPSKEIKVSRLEKNVDKIKEIYNLGLEDANNKLDELQKYLNS
ncbi:MAG: patatin family protein [Gemella sp.]|nr:patatin family protein [Gemella sp.]